MPLTKAGMRVSPAFSTRKVHLNYDLYIVEIHHSGWEPSNFVTDVQCIIL